MEDPSQNRRGDEPVADRLTPAADAPTGPNHGPAPNDTGGLAAPLEHVLTDAKLRKRLATEVHAGALDRFTVGVTTDGYLVFRVALAVRAWRAA